MTGGRALAAAAALALALTACSDSGAGEPRPLPSVTSSSPSPSPFVMPSYAATPSGAETAVRDYYAAVQRAAETGDTESLRARFLPGCAVCEDGADFIDESYARGRLTGFVIDVKAVVALELDAASAGVTTEFDQSSSRLTDAQGQVLDEAPAAAGVQDEILLRRQGDTWVIARLERVT